MASPLKLFLIFSALMITVIAFILYYIFQLRQTPSDPLEDIMVNSSNCARAKEKAENDFKNKAYRFVKWGIPNERTASPYEDLLEKRFGIKAIVGGCVPIENIECYNKRMWGLIANKFGSDTLTKTYIESKKINLRFRKNKS